MDTDTILSKLDEFFNDEKPEWVGEATETSIEIKTDTGLHTITQDDVNDFHVSMGSGYAELGDISGDWRPIRDLAEMCGSWFEFVNE